MDLISALKSFLRVAETRSFSVTAQERHRTQPAISRQISALEEYLNTRLVHRTTSGIALTDEGRALLPLVTRVLETAEELSDAARLRTERPAGRVRVSVPTPFGLFLGSRLGKLLQQHEALFVELMLRDEASDLIGDGLDLEVRIGSTTDSSLICRRLGSTLAFLVAAPSYLEQRGAPMCLEDLRQHECISYSRAGYEDIWWFTGPEMPISMNITSRYRANSATAVHEAALSGFGLAILSHLMAGPDIQAGRLVPVMTDYPPLRFPIYAVYPSRQNLPLRVRVVLDFLIDTLHEDAAMARSEEDGQLSALLPRLRKPASRT